MLGIAHLEGSSVEGLAMRGRLNMAYPSIPVAGCRTI
jgi:hypothetical protein